MKKTGKRIMAAVAMIVLMVGLSSCQKKEGTAEHVGKKIDQAVEKTGQQIEKAGDKIEDATSRK